MKRYGFYTEMRPNQNAVRHFNSNSLAINTNSDYFFNPKTFPMLRYLLFSMFFLFGIFQSLGQNAGDPGNFDIRGSVYSGTPTINVDDWFQGASGIGLIDESQTATFLSITQSKSNAPFYIGASHQQYELLNGSLLYQSIFARDYVNFNSLQSGNVDLTTFEGGNKNGDSPKDDWRIIPHTVLSKNDLVDNYIHLRRAGSLSSDDMWLTMGLSILGNTGTHYIDFELIASDIAVNAAGTGFINSGNEEGKNAWQFDAAGNTVKAGDLITGFEFSGPTVSNIEVRIWVSRDFYENGTPSSFTFGSEFDGAGTNSLYGYANVMLPAGEFYGQANTTSVSGPPWQTFNADTDPLTADYGPGELAEVGINLSSVGLDPTNAGGNPCDAPFIKIIVKSRSSDSFTAQLKDFAGPYHFLGTPIIDANITENPGYFTCTNNTLTLSPTNPAAIAYYEWLTTIGDGHFKDEANTIDNGDGTISYIAQNVVIDQPGDYTLNAAPLQGCTENSVTKTIIAQPCAIDDNMGSMVENGGSITYNILNNTDGTSDTDLENDIDISSINNIDLLQAMNGTVSINTTNGEITYTPNTDWYGVETFEYQICDLNSPPLCDRALITVTVLRDVDNDGIADIDDLDDDNDGILDTDECPMSDSGMDGPLPAANVSFSVTGSATNHLVSQTLNSVTINGTAYSDFTYPDAYNSSFANLDDEHDIYTITHGIKSPFYDTSSDWNTDAVLSFQNNDLNFYHGNDASMTTGDYIELFYTTPILITDGMFVAFTERGGNNTVFVQAFNGTTSLGSQQEIASGTSDYIDMGYPVAFGTSSSEKQNVNIGIFPMDDMGPIGAQITSIRIYYSDEYPSDGGDGKVFIFGNATSQTCDTDGDGIPNFEDTDSDGDGCSDANEAYLDPNADGGDGPYYGTGDPLTFADGEINAEGLVISAGISGSAYDNTTPNSAYLDNTLAAGCSDFGDAPDSYLTLFISNGPSHFVDGVNYLGAGVTIELDATGTTGTTDTNDDIVFPTLTQGATINIPLTVVGAGFLNAWIDFNGNGTFDATDKIADNSYYTAGNYNLEFTIPCDAVTTTSYARFRFGSSGIDVSGYDTTGEVEDYQVLIEPDIVLLTPDMTDQTICGDDLLISNYTTSPEGTTLIWQNSLGNTGAGNINQQLINNTAAPFDIDYTITATSANGCATATDAFTVTVNPKPLISTVNCGAEICYGETGTITLQSTVPGTEFSWTGDNGTSGTGDIVDAPLNSAIYKITGTANGCTSEEIECHIVVNQLPEITLNTPANACASGADMNFVATPAPSGNNTGIYTTTALAGLTDNGDGSATLDVSEATPGIYAITYTYTDVDGAACENSKTISVEVFDCALTVTKTQTNGPNPVTAAGQTLSYQIAVTNTGNISLNNVVPTETYPGGGTGTLSAASENGIANGILGINETWTYTATYTVSQDDMDSGTNLVNTISVVTDETPTPTDANTSTPITQSPSLAITKIADDDTNVILGQTVTYTYTVTNTGNVSVSNVTVNDAHTGLGSLGAITLQTTTGTDDTVDNDVDILAPTQTATWTATYEIIQADIDGNGGGDGTIENTATASGTPAGGILEDPSATAVIDLGIPPVAMNDSQHNTAPVSDTNPTIIVLVGDNDTDADGDVVVSTIDLNPSTAVINTTFTNANGTYETDALGNVTFTPNATLAINPTAIPYTIKDNDGNTSNEALLSVTYGAAPIATDNSSLANAAGVVSQQVITEDDSYGVDRDLDGSLVNSSIDLDPTTLGVNDKTLVVANEGTWTEDGAGNVSFTPQSGFTHDPAPITYTIEDNDGNVSNTASIVVDYVPVASNDSHNGIPSSTVTLLVLANDDTGDSVDPTTVQIVGTTNPGDALIVANQGTWTVNPTTGAITFTPATGFTADPTDITYTVNDDEGNISNAATITIDYNTQQPVASNNESLANAAGVVTQQVITEDDGDGIDQDPDGTLVASSIDLDPSSAGQQTSLLVSGQGTWSVDDAGNVSFTPEAGFTADPTHITYTINDNDDNVSNAANIVVDYVPVATDDQSVGNTTNHPVVVNVLANDNTGDHVHAATVQIGETTNPGDPLIVANEGTWTVNPTTGAITFTPESGFTANPTDITYTVKDDDGNTSAPANVNVEYNAQNPIATNNSSLANTAGTVTQQVITEDDGSGFDRDSDGSLAANSIDLDPSTLGINDKTLTVANQGTWAEDGAGNVSFSPLSTFTEDPDAITYTIEDNDGNESNIATIVVDYVPVAVPDESLNNATNTPITVAVLDNDTDGDLVNPISVSITGGTDTDADGTLDELVVANEGTWTVNSTTGEITFTPEPGYYGDPTAITYTVNDDEGNPSNDATVTIEYLQTLTINNVTVTEGDPLIFNIELNGANSTPVTFTPSLTNGSAIIGEDTEETYAYSLDGGNNWLTWISGDITIPASTTSVLFSIPSTEDILDEQSETFTLTTTVTSANTSNGSATANGTILDDDTVVAGTVFNDENRLTDGTVNGTGTNAGGLFANLVDPISNLVLASIPINTDGTYSFNSADHGVMENTIYHVTLTTTVQTEGASLTTAVLPIGWNSTGEHVGTSPGDDGVANSIITAETTTTGVPEANFGIVRVPDVTPIITAIPNVMHGVTAFNISVRITELDQVNTNGTITVQIPKDNRWILKNGYIQSLTQVGTITVNNSHWSYSQDDNYHIFTNISGMVIPAGGFSIFGFVAEFDPGNTKGLYTITSQITSGSGGEDRIDNNVDAEKLNYFIY